jgi:FlaA1/EpsC-like NDP-sugar epimerase
MYSDIFRYFNIFNFFKIIKIGIYNFIFLFFLIFLLQKLNFNLVYGTSYSLVFIYSIFFIFFSSFLRTSAVIFYNSFVHFRKKNILVIGKDEITNFFLNSSKGKNFSHIENLKTLNLDKIKEINKKIFKNNLDEIIFSQIFLQKHKNLENLNDYVQNNNLSLKVLDQKILKLKSDSASENFLRDVKLEDLIERTVEYKNNVDLEEIKNKCILVTGAAGSIGSELASRILEKEPKRLVLLDFSEINMFKLRDLLIKQVEKEKTKVDFILLNLNDQKEIISLFDKYNFDIVYHAAAYKHVNIVEENKASAFINNVVAFNHLIKISIKKNIKKFILISTDKAVNPTSFMGLTKRICEIILLYYSENVIDQDNNAYFIVRFGNVFESSGSVIPIFKKQINLGQPITVTSKNATRFFMSIPEAVILILSAQKIAKGNEIFIFEMGKPVKIIEIAQKLVFLSSLDSNQIRNTPIKIIGLREGEKEHEILSNGTLLKTKINNIYYSNEKKIDKVIAQDLIKKIENYQSDKDLLQIEDIVKKFE